MFAEVAATAGDGLASEAMAERVKWKWNGGGRRREKKGVKLEEF